MLRIAEESLRALATKLPGEFPLPANIPATHSMSQDATATRKRKTREGGDNEKARGGSRGKAPCRSTAGKGKGKARARRVVASSEDDDEEESTPPETDSPEPSSSEQESHGPKNTAEVGGGDASSSRHSHLRANEVEGEGVSQDESTSTSDFDDDEPAPIPDGYERVSSDTWEPTDKIDAFMFWTELDNKGKHPRWYCLKVIKVLAGKRWTYDAHVLGQPTKERRGVKVTKEHFNEGVFIPLVEMKRTHEQSHNSGCSPRDDGGLACKIPTGYQHIQGSKWAPKDHIDAFMFWTCLEDQEDSPAWYCFEVEKVLGSQLYTYIAHLLGKSKVRGIKVTLDDFESGIFIPLARSDTTHAHGSSSSNQPCDALEGSQCGLKQDGQPTRSRLARNVLPFHCVVCKAVDDFLYCPHDSVDGVVPKLMCRTCKPPSWVSMSRAAYARALER